MSTEPRIRIGLIGVGCSRDIVCSAATQTDLDREALCESLEGESHVCPVWRKNLRETSLTGRASQDAVAQPLKGHRSSRIVAGRVGIDPF